MWRTSWHRLVRFLPTFRVHAYNRPACAFYGLTLILLPFDPDGVPSINALLKQTNPDVLIAPGGLLPLDELKGVTLKELIYVVEAASSHLDFSSPDTNSKTYADIVSREGIEPVNDLEVDLSAPSVIICGPSTRAGIETVSFNHRNIIAAIASLNAALPKSVGYNADDTFVPADSLADLYTRIHLYTALAAGSTIALNPIAGRHASLIKTVKNVNPTIIAASTEALHAALRETRGSMIEMWHRMIHWFQLRTLSEGQIPKGNFWTRINDYTRPALGNRLRLVFTAESANEDDTTILSEDELNQMRAHLQAHIVYGLKSHKVAGPITLWNIYDYRVRGEGTHFGSVTPALEVKLVDSPEYKVKESGCGDIVISGMTIGNGLQELKLGVIGKFEEEGVLSYAG